MFVRAPIMFCCCQLNLGGMMSFVIGSLINKGVNSNPNWINISSRGLNSI